MKTVFLDTNILLDFLADRKPYGDDAARLFQHGESGKIRIYVSAISFNNLYYIMSKYNSHRKTIGVLIDLFELVSIIPVNETIILKSLHLSFNDFEDGIQYTSAESIKKIDAIITRNPKDFKKSKLAVWSPKDALSLIQ